MYCEGRPYRESRKVAGVERLYGFGTSYNCCCYPAGKLLIGCVICVIGVIAAFPCKSRQRFVNTGREPFVWLSAVVESSWSRDRQPEDSRQNSI